MSQEPTNAERIDQIIALTVAMTKSSASGHPILVRPAAGAQVAAPIAAETLGIKFITIIHDLIDDNLSYQSELSRLIEEGMPAAILVTNAYWHDSEEIAYLRQEIKDNQFVVIEAPHGTPLANSAWTVVQ